MAGAVKRTTGVLVVLALLFIAIIIILCLVPYSAPGGRYSQDAKSRPWMDDDVLTDTPQPTTTTPTTTTTTTTATTTTTTTTPTTTTTTTTSATTTPATTTTTTSTTAQPSTPSTTPSTTTHPPPPPPPPTTTTSSAEPTTTFTTQSTTTAPTTHTTLGTEITTTAERTPKDTDPTTDQVHSMTARTTTATPSPSTTESPTTAATSPPPPPLTTTSPTTTTTTPPQLNTTTAIPTATTTAADTTTTTAATTTVTTTSSSSDLYNVTAWSSVTEESSSPLPSTQTTSAAPNTTSEATSPSTEATTPYMTPTSTDYTTATSSISPPSSSSSSSSMTSPQPPATPCPTLAAPEPKDVCMSPTCKTLAARMLDLMDHTGTNPCKDFYQYACGGVTDDLFLAPESRQMVTYRLILDLIKNLSAEDPQLGTVKVFYDSCTSAEAESRNKTLWLTQVRALFDTVGSAFGPGNTASSTEPMDGSNINITQILIGMMKIHFAPFFDLLLDVSEDGTDEFVLMLTPALLQSPFTEDVARAVCYGEHLNRTNEALHSPSSSYDVNDDYEEYSRCMGSGRGLQARLQQMRQAVEELGLLHHFNYTIHKQGAEGLLVDNLMDTEFLLGDLYDILPKKPDLRNGHLKKNYQKVTLSYLEQKFTFPSFKVEWLTLVEELLGHSVDPANTTIHLYFENELFAAFEEIDFKDPPQLQRILLLLLAERLYTDLVHPAQDGLGKPEYCLRTTRELLGDFVSSLYVGGLPHIQERQKKIEEMVTASKEAAEKELNSQPNLQGGKADSWLKKLRDMSGEVASPDPSQYLLHDMDKPVLSDNFVDNCLILLTRYRSRMYQQYQQPPSSPSVLWSHFLFPYSFSGNSLYASNKFLIPYAAMEAPLFFWDVPDYINYAGVGHMIAHELMHGFDGTGSLYNGTHRHPLDGLRHFVNVSECLAYQYRSPHTLTAASGLIAKFTMLPLTSTFDASDFLYLHGGGSWGHFLSMNFWLTLGQQGLPGKLMHALLQQQGTRAPTVPVTHGSRLPWLDLNPLQLYFLRIAQKHCAPTSDTHMLAIMENEHLPAKLRVNLVLQNEPLFTEAFSCPAPPHQCPYVLG